MNRFFEELDPKQQEVVTSTEGPLLVFAGAGSGKTRSIIHRTAYLIQELGIFPWNILIVTFTNKAAKELKERLKKHFAVDMKSFWVGTFHSVCARILRIESDELPLRFDKNFTIYDKDDSLSLLRKVYKELNISNSQYPIKKVLSIISSMKNSLTEPEDFFEFYPINRSTQTIQKVYSLYQKRLRENNSLDFDDLLMVTAKLLSDYATVRNKYQKKFSYIMIDEYQDTNYAQFYIVKHLSGEQGNICVVGDDDQAIYSWRGATIKNILNFSSDFKEAKIVRLEQNYRSPQQILDRANKLIAENSTRDPKVLWSEDKTGEEPVLQVYETDRDEVEGILSRYLRLKENDPSGGETSVILYRTNAQSRLFETACLEHSITYKIHGSVNFFQRKEIKDIVAYLRILVNPNDRESLLRIINFPPRGIGQATINKLVEYSSKCEITLFEAMKSVSCIDTITKGIANRIQNLTLLIEEWNREAHNTEVTELLEDICEVTQIISYYKNCTDQKDIVRLENVFEFISAVKEYADNYAYETGEVPLLEGFLQNISLWTSLDSDYQTEEESTDVLNLMTLHNAKGLEFDNVFIAGIEEKLLPHQLCLESESEIEEERRLLYVGMTRAKKRLNMSFSRFRRSIYGYDATIPSRFITEVFPEYGRINKGRLTSLSVNKRDPSLGTYQPFPGQNKPSQNIRDISKCFVIGQRIKHSSFGEGIILNVVMQGNDAKLTVKFSNNKLLKVMGSFVEILTD